MNENISQEQIIETAQSEIQNSQLRTKNMEVHHHPHVGKNNFKEYFLKFIMIFLAVTLGFIAENIREHISEKSQTKELAKGLYKDIYSDSIIFTKITIK